jgi:AcrR family transcriptional regulator
MRARKRLTREESKEVTRMRLIEAAERLFVHKGFDDASVEEISETAGYSRGAFYSNFDNKEQVFLAVIDRRLPKALDDILRQASEPPEWSAAVREWFSNQWLIGRKSSLLYCWLLHTAWEVWLSIPEPECEHMYTEAAKLVFDRMTASEISHLG